MYLQESISEFSPVLTEAFDCALIIMSFIILDIKLLAGRQIRNLKCIIKALANYKEYSFNSTLLAV